MTYEAVYPPVCVCVQMCVERARLCVRHTLITHSSIERINTWIKNRHHHYNLMHAIIMF